MRGITGLGEVSATILLAELPNVEPKGLLGIADFTSKALSAFVGLSHPASDYSSGTSVRRSRNINRIRTERLRSTLYICAPSAKRTNKPLAALVAHVHCR